jgi:ABC-type glycerol-3-phosphate transport system permease component
MAVERKSTSATLWLVLLVVGLSSVLPLLWIVMGSFKPHKQIQGGDVWPWQKYGVYQQEAAPTSQPSTAPAQPTAAAEPAREPQPTSLERLSLDNYRRVFKQMAGLPTYYFNTLYLAFAGTFLSLLVGTLAAYGFAQFNFRGHKLLFALLLLELMIPGEVTLIGRIELMLQLRLFDTLTGLLIAYVAGNLLLVIFIMRNVFTSIPREVIHAAQIDGASTWQVFWEVMIPMGRNGLAACAILTFLAIWNEFIFALTFTSGDRVRTLPVGIYMLRDQYGLVNSGVLFATVLLSFLPIVIMFILLQRYFVRGLASGALKA